MDPEIVAHYELGTEEDRLVAGPSEIEFVRTKELLERFLPDPPARILDVGGGPGRYASWLAGLGYEVHLVDPVPLHIEQASARASSGPQFSAELGDARQLTSADESHDVVLVLGPLYHLPDRTERLQALSEARRAVRPEGLVVVATISRFSSLLYGLKSGRLAEPEFRAIVERDLETGTHRVPADKPDLFTTAYFHYPEELREEIETAGLRLEGLFGVEGPGWLLRADGDDGDDERDHENTLRAARAVESEATLMSVSSHLLGVGRR